MLPPHHLSAANHYKRSPGDLIGTVSDYCPEDQGEEEGVSWSYDDKLINLKLYSDCFWIMLPCLHNIIFLNPFSRMTMKFFLLSCLVAVVTAGQDCDKSEPLQTNNFLNVPSPSLVSTPTPQHPCCLDPNH